MSSGYDWWYKSRMDYHQAEKEKDDRQFREAIALQVAERDRERDQMFRDQADYRRSVEDPYVADFNYKPWTYKEIIWFWSSIIWLAMIVIIVNEGVTLIKYPHTLYFAGATACLGLILGLTLDFNFKELLWTVLFGPIAIASSIVLCLHILLLLLTGAYTTDPLNVLNVVFETAYKLYYLLALISLVFIFIKNKYKVYKKKSSVE